MFDYPLPLPTGTTYEELEIPADASSDEIREAISNAASRALDQKTNIDIALRKLYAQVPNLVPMRQSLKEILSGSKSVSDKEAQAARAKVSDLEREAERHHTGFRALEQRAEELTRRVSEINNLRLDDSAARRIYDEAHPPLALLKLADCARDAFTDNRTAIYLARREIARFLAKCGETVFHPSDLTRDDFTSDFMYCPILDEKAP